MMITVEEAQSILMENTFRTDAVCKANITDSLGCFIAEDIYAKLNLPPFNQSNVDGYAIIFSDSDKYKIKGEVKAGDNSKMKLKPGQAARVFTGAVVPGNADCVVMQENVRVENKTVIINQNKLTKGEFIRLKGSQIKKGELALTKDILITPAVIGFLAALGIATVKVYKRPVIHLLITGNELQTPGKKLRFGKVYESNSFIIESALKQMNLQTVRIKFIKDKKNKLTEAVSESLEEAPHVILISGGVSVGKYDFVNEVLEKLSVSKLFYKVSQRPGKPLYFGKKGKTYVFGLPGNPASVFTCFYEYVYPMLRKFQGYDNIFLTRKMLPALNDINKNFSLSNFLKARIINKGVESLEGQASYILNTFSKSDCFIYLPKDKSNVKKGEEVEVHLFPG